MKKSVIRSAQIKAKAVQDEREKGRRSQLTSVETGHDAGHFA